MVRWNCKKIGNNNPNSCRSGYV